MTNGDWIALAGLLVTMLGGGIGWLTYIALKVGKILEKLEHFDGGIKTVRRDVQKLDERVDAIERRAIPAMR